MKKTAALFLLILFSLSVFVNGQAQGETEREALESILQDSSGAFSCVFDGVKHSFLLDLPEKCEGAPLVLMLPGYGNTAEAFRTEVHFEQKANAQGYAVAYVTGAPDPGAPTSSIGWHSEIDTEGNRDTEFLIALTKYLQETYLLDQKHTCAVGFSNGACMVHCLAMEAGEFFSAFVSVAGLMPESVWEARRETNALSFFQITGEKDPVVPKNSDGSARYAKAPAIEDVMEYWADSNDLELQETKSIGSGSTLTRYGSGEKPQQVWHLFVKDGRHSWPSEKYNRIDTNALILEFLENQ